MSTHTKRFISTAILVTVLLLVTLLAAVACSSSSVIRGNPELLTDIIYFEDDFSDMDNWEVAGGSARVVSANGRNILRFTTDDVTSGIVLKLKPEIWQNIAAQSAGNFYVEMDMTLTSDSRGNKNIGIASDISPDGNAFYYGGINYNNRLQMGYLPGDGKGYQNTSGIPMVKPDGEYRTDGYKLRYEIRKDGGADIITMFMNDIPIGKNNTAESYTIPDANKVADGSSIGVYSSCASFDLAYVKVGNLDSGKTSLLITTEDPDFVQLSGSIAYRETAKTLRSGGTPLAFTVTAKRVDGSDDGYVLTASSDVVNLSALEGQSGTSFSVTAVKVGQAELIIANRSDPTSFRKILFTVEESLSFVKDNYSGLSGILIPAPESAGIFEDTRLSIAFDDVPVLAESGAVYIHDAATHETVDIIQFSAEKNIYGVRSLNVSSQLVSVQGKSVEIIPHSGKLQAGKEYYVAIPNEVISGNVNGVPFTGFNPADRSWTFTARATHTPNGETIRVASSGNADFRTIQGALDYAAANSSGGVSLSIAPGVYRENLTWDNSRALSLVGTGATNADTLIAFENYESLNSGTDNRALFLMKKGNVSIENLTIENIRKKGGVNSSSSNQAETIYFNNDSGAFIAKNVRFISRQDTIQIKGFSWFYNCYITGDVDFIWGGADTALFENCIINARTDDRSVTQVSYVLQARARANKKGFIFLNCDFTADADRAGAVYFARASGSGAGAWDSIAIIKSRIDDKYISVGWSDDGKTVNPAKASASVGWREYGNVKAGSNAPLDTSQRHGASYIMTDAEYQAGYSDRLKILAGTPLAGE
jgi:pectin methylesterase-like acyl-CoA thioesterase